MISNIQSNHCTWFMFIWQAESSDDELADHQFSLLDLKPRELVEASSSEFNLPCQRTWFDHPVSELRLKVDYEHLKSSLRIQGLEVIEAPG